MRTVPVLSSIVLSVLLLAGCAPSAPERASVETQVQNCMNGFLQYAAENFPDDPRIDPENTEKFDEFITELQGKCESDQKDDPEGFYANYGVTPEDNVTE